MCDLRENKFLYKSLLYTFGLMFLLASELLPFLNTFLELHELPTFQFKCELIALMLFDVAATMVYSKTLRNFFAIKPNQQQNKAVQAAIAHEQARLGAEAKKLQ
jgi:hypothetical protein